MFNRDKYAEYLDSATIYKFVKGLDPKLSKKLFSLRFHPPTIGLNHRFFDMAYDKPGMFIVRNRNTSEIIRFGFSNTKVRDVMYRYLWRLPKSLSINCDCAILLTHNGEQKDLARLLEKVINFEVEYHNYFLLKEEIENSTDGKINIQKLQKVFPYTGRTSLKGMDRKEWSIPAQSWKSGVYVVWKDDKIDYIGKGKKLAIRLYSHFLDMSKYKERGRNGAEYSHRHVYYPPEEIEQGRIKIAIIPVYRKMTNDSMPWQEKNECNLVEENDLLFQERICNLEMRLIKCYMPPNNINMVSDDNFEEDSQERISIENEEDPPF